MGLSTQHAGESVWGSARAAVCGCHRAGVCSYSLMRRPSLSWARSGALAALGRPSEVVATALASSMMVGSLRALAMSAMERARLATYPARCLSGVSGGARISAGGRPVAGFSGKAVVRCPATLRERSPAAACWVSERDWSSDGAWCSRFERTYAPHGLGSFLSSLWRSRSR